MPLVCMQFGILRPGQCRHRPADLTQTKLLRRINRALRRYALHTNPRSRC